MGLTLVHSTREVLQSYWGELTGSGEVKLHRYVGGQRELMVRPGKLRGPFLAKSRNDAYKILEKKLGVMSRRRARASPGRTAA